MRLGSRWILLAFVALALAHTSSRSNVARADVPPCRTCPNDGNGDDDPCVWEHLHTTAFAETRRWEARWAYTSGTICIHFTEQWREWEVEHTYVLVQATSNCPFNIVGDEHTDPRTLDKEMTEPAWQRRREGDADYCCQLFGCGDPY